MKKSLLALAVLGAFAGVASAQSSVTLFGVVDVAVQQAKSTGSNSTQKVVSGSNATSRLGFRGVEDIGGGLKAGFWLEGAINPDTGDVGGLNFRRRETVSLMGGFGEVRIGRDYTPTFWNDTIFDPFGTNGVGSTINVARMATAATTAAPNAAGQGGIGYTFVRADNSVGYFLPSDLGGLYGQVMAAAPEGNVRNKYMGARVGYGAGPVNVALAFASQNASVTGVQKYKTVNLGASYDLGVAKVLFLYDQEKENGGFGGVAANGNKEVRLMLGTVVPMGAGEFKLSLSKSNGSGTNAAQNAADATQVAVGYVHNLSKRTALYTHYSQLSNKGNLKLSNNGVTPIPDAAGKSKAKGFEVGVRHNF